MVLFVELPPYNTRKKSIKKSTKCSLSACYTFFTPIYKNKSYKKELYISFIPYFKLEFNTTHSYFSQTFLVSL